jgi:hypothetical protein
MPYGAGRYIDQLIDAAVCEAVACDALGGGCL